MRGDLTDLQAADIGAGKYPRATLLLFDLVEGPFGFWNGTGTLNFNSLDYVGAGSLIAINQVNMGVQLAASPLQVSLRSQPDSTLTPDLLATIDSYGYKNRPAFIYFTYFDPATGAQVVTVRAWQGYIDTIEHPETPGGSYMLVGNLEPRSLDYSRPINRMSSHQDQLDLTGGVDMFFEHQASVVTETLQYGKNPNAAAPVSGGSVAGRGRGG